MSALGVNDKIVAHRLSVSPQAVSKWRNRFAANRLDGLLDAPCSGVPRTHRRCACRRRDCQDARNGAEQRHPLEYAQHGARDGAVADRYQSNLARLRSATAQAGNLQTLHRPVVRRQGPRHRWLVSGSAGEGDGALCRREEPDTGARSHAADSAARTGAS